MTLSSCPFDGSLLMVTRAAAGVTGVGAFRRFEDMPCWGRQGIEIRSEGVGSDSDLYPNS